MNFLNIAYKRASFFKKVLEARITGKLCPLVVTFSMTSRCNFRCKYCYGDYESRKNKEITIDEVLDLVNEMSDMGMRYLQLSGGEPLMFPGIEKVVDLANQRGVCLGINTNGSLIPEKLEVVKKIQTVCVSLDGYEEVNDSNRGVGSYRKIMDGIKAAKSIGTRVHIYATMSKNNIHALDWLMEFCKKNNIYSEFGFLVNRSLKNDNDYQGIDLDTETFRKSQARLVEYKKNGYPILFSKQVLERIQNWPDFSKKMWFDTPPSFDYIPCSQGRLMVFIDCDGKVYPCIQMIGKFDALDFRKDGFSKAFTHCQSHTCKACYLMCVNDFNLLFAMNSGVIMNNILITLKESIFS
ncbi:radical SAM protein [Patescibacteria group bacterium]